MELMTATVFTLVFFLEPAYNSSTSFVIDNIASKEECASVGSQISSEIGNYLSGRGVDKGSKLNITYSCLPVKKAQIIENKTRK